MLVVAALAGKAEESEYNDMVDYEIVVDSKAVGELLAAESFEDMSMCADSHVLPARVAGAPRRLLISRPSARARPQPGRHPEGAQGGLPLQPTVQDPGPGRANAAQGVRVAPFARACGVQHAERR